MKKYYSISEISKILQIPTHQLRYLEKTTPKFVVSKIKGRRYYTTENIEFIKSRFIIPTQLSLISMPEQSKCDNNLKLTEKIDNLIIKFNSILEIASSSR